MAARNMITITFWIVEISLVLSVVIAIGYYIKALRTHKTPTKPGAVIDLCGISAVAFPIICALAKWRLEAKSIVSLICLGVACLVYGIAMGMDSAYLKRADRVNKEVNAKKYKGGKKK